MVLSNLIMTVMAELVYGVTWVAIWDYIAVTQNSDTMDVRNNGVFGVDFCQIYQKF